MKIESARSCLWLGMAPHILLCSPGSLLNNCCDPSPLRSGLSQCHLNGILLPLQGTPEQLIFNRVFESGWRVQARMGAVQVRLWLYWEHCESKKDQGGKQLLLWALSSIFCIFYSSLWCVQMIVNVFHKMVFCKWISYATHLKNGFLILV